MPRSTLSKRKVEQEASLGGLGGSSRGRSASSGNAESQKTEGGLI